MRIAGSTALVTGAAGSIGFAIARQLRAAGARIAMLDIHSNVLRTAADIGALGIVCDVGDAAAVDTAFATAAESYATPQILINSAGMVRFGPIVGSAGPMPLEAFHEVVRANLAGTFHTIRRFAADLASTPAAAQGECRGVIVNFSSSAAADGSENEIGYVAAKGAINAMTLSVARELGRYDIRVLTIQPGLVRSPIMDIAALSAYAAANQPFPRRLAEPEECAAFVADLIENDYVNGTILRFDGARRSGYPTTHPAAGGTLSATSTSG